jgi:hypothetical protein
MPRKQKTVVMVVLLATALGACSQAPRPGVKMRSLATDIGLGVVRPASATAPEAFPPINIPPGFQGPPPIVVTPRPFCPEAGLFDFADPTVQDFASQPAKGAYLWRYKLKAAEADEATALFGHDIFTDFGGVQKLQDNTDVERFGVRSVRLQSDQIEPIFTNKDTGTPIENPQEVRDHFNKGAFQYSLVEQPPFGFPSMGPTVFSLGREDIFRVQPASYASRPEAPSDLGEGLALVDTLWAEGDPKKQLEQTPYFMFEELPNLFPTPASIGNIVRWGFASQSVDARTLAVPFLAPGIAAGLASGRTPSDDEMALLQKAATPGPRVSNAFTGQVTGIQTVDACGDLVDAYLVKGTLVTTRDDLRHVFDYSYAVAPQIGGMIVYQRLAYPATQTSLSLRGEPGTPTDTEIVPSQKPRIVYEASMARLNPF